MDGNVLFTNINIAFSGSSFILLRITYTNWPTVKSAGTKYLFKKFPKKKNFNYGSRFYKKIIQNKF